jgi:adenosylcobinamide-phosphate synthase
MVRASGGRTRLARRCLGTGVGLAVDAALGEPPRVVHPVAAFGAAMSELERRHYGDHVRRGAWYAGVGVAGAASAGRALEGVAGPGAAAAIAVALCSASRELNRAALEIAQLVDRGDLDGARAALPALVGRDPTGLDEKEIARAVVESVAENLSDAVVATALWGACGGAAGAFAHRAANTLDAMVGYRNDRYRRFGWASARLDDVMGWPAARLTAVLVAMVTPRRAPAIWVAVRRDAPDHPSPNSGVAEAAFAAALDLRLGGANRYGDRVEIRPSIGTGRPADSGDIARAVGLARRVTVALGLLCVLVALGTRRPSAGGGRA